MARNFRLLQVAGAVVRWGVRLILLLLLVFAGLVIAYRFINPVSTLILGRWLLHEKVEQKWVPLADMSEALRAAVVTSEDAHFCRHHGVDWGAMRAVINESGIGGPERGASTITMQVAKNLFLWPGRSYIRKALEIPLALILDFVWPKRRILEIYLNIAEWGDNGLFGAEAAADFYFHTPAAALTLHQAALLAAVLPDPYHRKVLKPNRHVAIHARIVEARVRSGQTNLSCVR